MTSSLLLSFYKLVQHRVIFFVYMCVHVCVGGCLCVFLLASNLTPWLERPGFCSQKFMANLCPLEEGGTSQIFSSCTQLRNTYMTVMRRPYCKTGTLTGMVLLPHKPSRSSELQGCRDLVAGCLCPRAALFSVSQKQNFNEI